jgi:hypothetical protein
MCLELKVNLFTDRKTRTKTEVNMKKIVKCKPSKSQTRKRQVLLRISNSSGSKQDTTVHLRDTNREAECPYCYSLVSEDPEGEEWVCCSV